MDVGDVAGEEDEIDAELLQAIGEGVAQQGLYEEEDGVGEPDIAGAVVLLFGGFLAVRAAEEVIGQRAF